jgi:hypothetical protein
VPTDGKPKLTVHMDGTMRDDLVAAAPPAERGRESGAAKVIREFVAWYLHYPGAKLPKRPPVAAWKGRQAKGDHDAASRESK